MRMTAWERLMMNNGDKELSVQNYRKSVELNPANENGSAALKKLEAQ